MAASTPSTARCTSLTIRSTTKSFTSLPATSASRPLTPTLAASALSSAVILNADGSINALYRKMHIPDDPLYYEKFYFTPGDLGFKAFDTDSGRIGTLVRS